MRILVPIDGSMPSHHAVRLAISLSQDRADAAIILLNVQNRATLVSVLPRLPCGALR
ncbi:universal stress protein [Roseomonas sp. E05]|uniref:universal stress protein n=1 Tax=Roseomonas sp. E05 TaxID=3046310 RepID=UPI0024B8BA88|nr:universal stress protein [Roseomonas sp. E05]MDJ0387623.1 universal stress protein [Roseomonas sp. E05]